MTATTTGADVTGGGGADDRRRLTRQNVDADSRLRFHLGHIDDDGATVLDRSVSGGIEAEIVDVSRHGMRIRASIGDVGGLRSGDMLCAGAIISTDGRVENLRELIVRSVMSERATATVLLGIEALDEHSRAVLWEFGDDLVEARARVRRDPVAGRAADRVPGRGLYDEAARLERLDWIRARTKTSLKALARTNLEPERLSGNIENMIGAIELPVGLAGPLRFNGREVNGVIYAPLATSEGALVASAARGATTLTEAGGVRTHVLRQRMLRAPMFVFGDVTTASKFTRWVLDHIDDVRSQVRTVSSHAELVQLEPFQIGNIVHVRFAYETGDAAGQNMTTSCTWKACRWILETLDEHYRHLQVENFTLEGNMSGDKKVNFLSFIAGRGVRVSADAFIPGEVLGDVLKVTPEGLARSYQHSITGGLQSGMIGYNINVANVIAAIFAATGQDIACVHESALGILHVNAADGGLYASMLLPGLAIGTVGGGTHLPGQHDCLAMIGCDGPGKVGRLAEIIAGFCLALDLSTMSAIENGSFAAAHDRLGRNRPVRHLTADEMTTEFFRDGLRAALADPRLDVTSAEPVRKDLGTSIISELSSRGVQRFAGIVPYRLGYRGGDGHDDSLDVIVKVKPLDTEVSLIANTMATACGEPLASAFAKHRLGLPFTGTHVRELAIADLDAPAMRAHRPRTIRTFRDDAREAYVLVQEYLADDVILKDSVDTPEAWTPDHIEAALRGIGECHAVYYDQAEALRDEPWLAPTIGLAEMVEMAPLWEALVIHGGREFPEWFQQNELDAALALIHEIPRWWGELAAMPQTLIHNDFSLRNVALRTLPDGGHSLVAWDWELATVHVPQRDLAEFLAFCLPEDVDEATVTRYLDCHRTSLATAAGVEIDPDLWRRGYQLSLYDFAITKVPLYIMGHTFRDYRFLDRVVRMTRHLMLVEFDRLGQQVTWR